MVTNIAARCETRIILSMPTSHAARCGPAALGRAMLHVRTKSVGGPARGRPLRWQARAGCDDIPRVRPSPWLTFRQVRNRDCRSRPESARTASRTHRRDRRPACPPGRTTAPEREQPVRGPRVRL